MLVSARVLWVATLLACARAVPAVEIAGTERCKQAWIGREQLCRYDFKTQSLASCHSVADALTQSGYQDMYTASTSVGTVTDIARNPLDAYANPGRFYVMLARTRDIFRDKESYLAVIDVEQASLAMDVIAAFTDYVISITFDQYGQLFAIEGTKNGDNANTRVWHVDLAANATLTNLTTTANAAAGSSRIMHDFDTNRLLFSYAINGPLSGVLGQLHLGADYHTAVSQGDPPVFSNVTTTLLGFDVGLIAGMAYAGDSVGLVLDGLFSNTLNGELKQFDTANTSALPVSLGEMDANETVGEFPMALVCADAYTTRAPTDAPSTLVPSASPSTQVPTTQAPSGAPSTELPTGSPTKAPTPASAPRSTARVGLLLVFAAALAVA